MMFSKYSNPDLIEDHKNSLHKIHKRVTDQFPEWSDESCARNAYFQYKTGGQYTCDVEDGIRTLTLDDFECAFEFQEIMDHAERAQQYYIDQYADELAFV